MIVKIFGSLELDGEVRWIDANIDKHAISMYYPNPMFIEGVEVESNEWIILIGGAEVVIKEDLNLLNFLQYKFEK